MLARIDLREDRGAPAGRLPRARVDVAAAAEAVRPLCAAVRERGSAAVLELSEQFDRVRPPALRVPADVIAGALGELAAPVRAALETAVTRLRAVHQAQRSADVTVTLGPGAEVTERWVPVGRVGVYVPGGHVAYPSSVVMNVVPAEVAGVSSVALASPPQPAWGGWPHPVVLAAAALLGIDEVYAAGGAQAVAMFAYGTEDCPRVDVVSGPGNVYVAAAKRLLRGTVGVDAEAGPTEIAILADDGAPPAFVAADLVAQAEHDELAACLLVTTSAALAAAVDDELARQVPATPHRERVETALRGQSATVLVRDLDQGLAVVDDWAPEHLEVMTEDALSVAARVRNAGAVFVGPYTPVSLGDYLAGSNHVLPTGGTARFSGGLSVQSFMRPVHVVHYDRNALAEMAPHVRALGTAEDLGAHVAAVAARLT